MSSFLPFPALPLSLQPLGGSLQHSSHRDWALVQFAIYHLASSISSSELWSSCSSLVLLVLVRTPTAVSQLMSIGDIAPSVVPASAADPGQSFSPF